MEVLEDRSLPEGRRIGLRVVVVPALSNEPPEDPVFVFEGGPGGAATRRAAGSVWAGPVRTRDIVLVDQRGTGGSAPLDCDLGGGATRLGELREMFPPGEVEACARRLAQRADLSRYTSRDHADDMEEVRRRLGYGPINLRGGSYGTQAMMVFAQLYPQSTRTMFGIGWSSPDRSNLAERGVMAERALSRLAALCDADADCRRWTPGLDRRVTALLESVGTAPREVRVTDPQDPERTLAFELRRDWLSEMVRLNLYFAYTSNALPFALRRAEAGDWEPLVQLGVLIERSFRSTLSYGVLLTVQCSEGMGFDSAAALAAGSSTLFGNYRLAQQIQGCSEWPHRRLPPLGVDTPRELPIPTLMLSGYLDPVTPPDSAEEARRLLPRSLHVVLPEGGHGPFDLEGAWPCVHQMWSDLLEHADPEAVDVSCTETIARPPFIVDAESWERYLDEVLLPWSG